MPAKRSAVAALAGALLLTACVTGERPSFADDLSAPGTPVGDAAIDTVLQRLDNPSPEPFTAEYTILTKLSGTTTDATVAVDVDRRSVTIGSIRFLIEGARVGTCDLATATCSTSIDDARVSDIQVTHQFYAEAAARRLRADAAVRIGQTTLSAATLGGFAASCVSVPVANGTPVFCVLQSGLLAMMDEGDVTVTLISVRGGVDETAFAPGGG